MPRWARPVGPSQQESNAGQVLTGRGSLPRLSPRPGQAFMTRPRNGVLHTRRRPSWSAPPQQVSLCLPGQGAGSVSPFHSLVPLGHGNIWVPLLTNPCPAAAAASLGRCQASLLHVSAGVLQEPPLLAFYLHSRVLTGSYSIQLAITDSSQ